MNFKHLFFDLDNTLYDFDKSERVSLQKALSEIDIPFEENLLQVYKKINKACWLDFENGVISQTDLRHMRYERFFEALSIKNDPVQFGKRYLTHLSECDFLYDTTIPLLKNLQSDFHLYIISNGLKEVQRPKIEKCKITSFFKKIVISDEIGIAKPYSGFFDIALENINKNSYSNCLIIGDNLNSDIKGGINYGLKTCWYNPKKEKNTSKLKPDFNIHDINQLFDLLKIS